MKRRLVTVLVAGLVAAGTVLAAPAAADENDDWVCVGIVAPVDRSVCPGSPYRLLPDPLVPALPRP